MEKKVEQISAMFQKAESDIKNVSQKLKVEFEANDEIEVNPVRLMDKVSDVKKDISSILQEAATIKEAQEKAVNEFKGQINDACKLLEKLQSNETLASGEKPEELIQLEKLLGLSMPWNENPEGTSIMSSSNNLSLDSETSAK